jgi:hypothetical protein
MAPVVPICPVEVPGRDVPIRPGSPPSHYCKSLFLALFAEFLSALLRVDEYVIGVPEPLFLCLANLSEPAPIVQFSGVQHV